LQTETFQSKSLIKNNCGNTFSFWEEKILLTDSENFDFQFLKFEVGLKQISGNSTVFLVFNHRYPFVEMPHPVSVVIYKQFKPD
jgi:hypothetical protein